MVGWPGEKVSDSSYVRHSRPELLFRINLPSKRALYVSLVNNGRGPICLYLFNYSLRKLPSDRPVKDMAAMDFAKVLHHFSLQNFV